MPAWRVWLAVSLLLVGCSPQPTAAPPPATSLAATAQPPTLAPALLATAAPASPPVPTEPPGPRTLTFCLATEPASLYPYARPEPGRAHLLAALTDGPIDAHDYAYTPVLIDPLPSAANGGVQTRTVRASPGEIVVDTLGRVQPLAAGLGLLQADGRLLTYDGAGPVDLPQVQVTFHLRPGLLWSDGAPLTAADSVFAYELGRSPDATDPRAVIAQRTASYTAPTADTLVWTGLPGYVDPLAFTYLWPPLPRHRWQGLSPVDIADSTEANRGPLSYGPFVLVEWIEGERAVLARNPHYWRAAEGLPWLDQVEVKFVDGAEALAAALRSGTCHLAPSGLALDEAAPVLATASPMHLVHVPGPVLEHLDFNLLPAAGSTLFADLRVRQGLAHCLNRSALSPYPDEPAPATYLPAGHPLHAASVALYGFDPARGRALMAEAGWQADQSITLVGGPAESPARVAIMQAIAAQWQNNCGVAVTVQALTDGELLGDWPLGALFGRRFDLAVFGWRVSAVPPCGLYTSAQIADDLNPAGANAAGYANPAYDDACRRALTAPDLAAAAQAHAEAQRLLAADLPMLPLFFRPRHGAALPNVAGYTLDSSSESELWNIELIELN